MTGHTSHEKSGQEQGGDQPEQRDLAQRGRGIADNLNQDRGVVQDGPGTQELGFADEQNSQNGNLTEAETGRPDPEFGEGAEP